MNKGGILVSGKIFSFHFICLIFLFPIAAGAALLSPAVQQESVTVTGSMIFEKGSDIYLQSYPSGKMERIASASRYPRWSSSGKQFAFIQGKDIVTVRADDPQPTQHRRISAEAPHALSFSQNDTHLLYNDGNILYELNLADNSVKKLFTSHTIYEIDSSRSGDKIAFTEKPLSGYQVVLFDRKDKTMRTVRKGCSASISPDGSLVSVLSGNHRKLFIYDTENLEIAEILDAPPAKKFDNQAWSNDKDLVLSTIEGKATSLALHNIRNSAYIILTPLEDYDRGDFFLSKHD